jgi:hypothetical protein
MKKTQDLISNTRGYPGFSGNPRLPRLKPEPEAVFVRLLILCKFYGAND